MQMARTRLSPMCCATSATIDDVLPSTVDVELERAVQFGQAVGRELDVDDGADDGDDAPVLESGRCQR